jgi:hypothetical protein
MLALRVDDSSVYLYIPLLVEMYGRTCVYARSFPARLCDW